MSHPTSSKSTDRATDRGRESRRIDSAALFKGKTPQQWRTEYADAYDWGPDIGREVVDE